MGTDRSNIGESRDRLLEDARRPGENQSTEGDEDREQLPDLTARKSARTERARTLNDVVQGIKVSDHPHPSGTKRDRQEYAGEEESGKVQSVRDRGKAVDLLHRECCRHRPGGHRRHEDPDEHSEHEQSTPVDLEAETVRDRDRDRIEKVHKGHRRGDRTNKYREPARRGHPKSFDDTRSKFEDRSEPLSGTAREGEEREDPGEERIEHHTGRRSSREVLEERSEQREVEHGRREPDE